MTRKAAQAKIPGTNATYAVPPATPKAPAKPPLRVVQGAMIDPGAKDAKTRLNEAYPRVTANVMLEATQPATDYARRYLLATQATAKLEAEKELCGNHLKAMIGGNAGIEGASFVATWGERAGDVDWRALATELKIDDATIERFRKPIGRSIGVKAKVV